MYLKLEELAEASLNRKRGKEAYDALRRRDTGSQMEIDLNGVELPSLSFLDEFIFRLEKNGMLGRALFVTAKPQHLAKLARVSEIRNVEIRRMADGRPEVIEPKPGPKLIKMPAGQEPPEGLG